ncbi:threonine ammonia-lyase IlvA [Tropicimonas sp. IMCC34011]|uniref:threonine ammonia-lyase IlvA n=1 Tax=Tropicimonas sp. IMCC34011 TaxID=2248759 RepID=UPI000E23D730|nr:threonine ammonia-lyase IlvA [Tropicimonas sp. IMCC34011]
MDDFIQGAQAAEAAMRELFPPTPLLRNDYLSDRFGGEILLKREDLTPVRSYKLRGAFNAMRKVRQADPGQNLFVCASAGNHAQGVAYACRHFGVRAVIFMPVTTPRQKVDKTVTLGGDHVEVRMTGDYFDDTLDEAQEWCAAEGGHFLSPFDDPDVIEGQASVAAEILSQIERPDGLILPVGGGGLSAGITRYLRAEAPEIEIRYVEPEGAASLAAAVRGGAPETLSQVDSFVDGAAVARIGARPFEVLSSVRPDQVLRVPENRLCITISELLNAEGIVLEPAGALSVDALRDLGDWVRGRRIVCVTSGGNFDFERLPEVKERAQRYAGLKKYLILRMPQRPGALRDFLDLLGPEDDIARFEYLKKSNRNFGSVLLGIETTDPANFERFFERLAGNGLVWRDITNDDTMVQFVI